jgi:short-subunit dehydrogenase
LKLGGGFLTDYRKVALVVGASSGVGEATARMLASEGYAVYAGARRFPAYALTGPAVAGVVQPVHMDVREDASVSDVVAEITAHEGGIGVLVYCPGYALAGSVEDVTPAEARDALETMVLGAHRAYRAVLPVMRKQGDGVIVAVSSVAGFIALPYQGWYSTSKYALEALTESLRMEVSGLGIRVSIVEPGDIRTGFTTNRVWAANAKNGAYADETARAVEAMSKSELAAHGPEPVAVAIVAAVHSKNPPVRSVLGVEYKLVALARRLLPDSLVNAVVKKLYS